MYQIDVPSAASVLPASTAAGVAGYFTDGSVVGGVNPTILPAEFLNAVMLELLNIVTAGGGVPVKGSSSQVLLAIENLIEARSGNYVLDTGAASAYVVALSPAVTHNTSGLAVKFRARFASTGPSTLNVGAGPAPLLRDDGTPTRQGDIPLSSVVSVTFDSTAGAYLLNSIVPSQLGALAVLNVGAGLYLDGSGNLAASVTPSQLLTVTDALFFGQL